MESGATGPGGTPFPHSSTTIKNTNGEEVTTTTGTGNTTSFVNALNHMATGAGTNSTTYIKCGTGTTAATEDDYELEVGATGLTCDSVVTAVGSNDAKTYTATFSNTTDTDIVVTEIGFFMCYAYTGGSPLDNFLLDRIVLNTPITIPAGESKAITYELGF